MEDKSAPTASHLLLHARSSRPWRGPECASTPDPPPSGYHRFGKKSAGIYQVRGLSISEEAWFGFCSACSVVESFVGFNGTSSFHCWALHDLPGSTMALIAFSTSAISAKMRPLSLNDFFRSLELVRGVSKPLMARRTFGGL